MYFPFAPDWVLMLVRWTFHATTGGLAGGFRHLALATRRTWIAHAHGCQALLFNNCHSMHYAFFFLGLALRSDAKLPCTYPD